MKKSLISVLSAVTGAAEAPSTIIYSNFCVFWHSTDSIVERIVLSALKQTVTI